MIRLKTASLIAASCKIGAIIATDDEDVWDTWFKFGHSIGMTFQIQDDILDLYANLDDLGKDIASDIFNEKNSILTILARENNIDISYTDDKDKNEFIEYCRTILDNSGVKEKAQSLKSTHQDQTIEILNSIPESSMKSILVELVDNLYSRTN